MREARHKNPHIQRAIGLLGRQTSLAAALGVAQQTVSKLLYEEISVSAEVASRLDQISNGEISKSELRPDLWPPAPSPEQQGAVS
jgi:DNA-binding transcriptional regulator YdaS (Cro superfamily)